MILEGILQALDVERGAFFLLTQNGTELELLHSAGLSAERAEKCGRLMLDPGTPEAQTLESGSRGARTVSLEYQPESALLNVLGFDSAIFAPAASEKKAFGLLAIDLPGSETALLDAAAPLVESFAGICGLAMENCVLVADLDRRNKRVEQTLLELTQAQAALNDSSKLATLGALISGLGHSLNNRLAPILGYAQMFVRKYADDEKLKRQMQLIERSALELKDILERLVSITRGKPPVYRPDSLNEAIESALALAEPSFKADGIEVVANLDPNLPALNLDRQQMIQGFLSIFHRAQSIYPPHVPNKCLRISSSCEGNRAVVRIVDNGSPLTEENLADIVDPLKPLQRVGFADVFNLSIPCSIVQKHGGQFKVSDLDGQGTAIEIRIAPQAVPVSQKPGSESQMIG
jgi:signal transduction histidine kinase